MIINKRVTNPFGKVTISIFFVPLSKGYLWVYISEADHMPDTTDD
jgi:hypothetical protein